MATSILVNKAGGVFYTRDAVSAASASGEQGETEGVLRFLASDPRLRVVYFGQLRDAGKPIPNVTVVQSHIKGLNDCSTVREQEDGFAQDIAELDKYAPYCGCINIAGYSPTWGIIDNPHYAHLQSVGVLHTGPIVNAIQHYKLKRCLINNDPRTYPKHQEMSYPRWSYTRPVALLDQWANGNEVTCIVGGKRYLRKSVYAACESWGYHIDRSDTHIDYDPCVIVAHAHVNDGVRRGSEDAWDIVLHDCDEYPLYGAGWEHTRYNHRPNLRGPLKMQAAMDELWGAMTCPIVAHTSGFLTGKPFVCINQGCIPILFGDASHSHTWDPYGQYMPVGSEWRVVERTGPRSLKSIVQRLRDDRGVRDELRAYWKQRLVPDWSVLLELIDVLLADTAISPDRFGGYLTE